MKRLPSPPLALSLLLSGCSAGAVGSDVWVLVGILSTLAWGCVGWLRANLEETRADAERARANFLHSHMRQLVIRGRTVAAFQPASGARDQKEADEWERFYLSLHTATTVVQTCGPMIDGRPDPTHSVRGAS